ncbi:MAG TPA: hypothetical protein VGN22_12905, partial [Pseudonocardia sp.]
MPDVDCGGSVRLELPGRWIAAPGGTGRDGCVDSGVPGSVGVPLGVSAALATRNSCTCVSSLRPSS